MAIAIVTDSTSDLPIDIVNEKGITVVPLSIQFGEKTLEYNPETFSDDEFFDMITAQNILPTTSQPPIGKFIQVYEELAKEYSHIVSLHIASTISGTYNSAYQAATEVMSKTTTKIAVIDTYQASMALGLTVIAAADASKQGASFNEVIDTGKQVASRSRFLGLLDTLTYLHKGGRIGKSRLLLGSMLRIKPVLELSNGVASPIDRAHTYSKGIVKLIANAAKSAPLSSAYALYTTASTDDIVEQLRMGIAKFVPEGEVRVSRIGPVVGTYLGPHALGLAISSYK